MDFELTEEQKEIKSLIRQFAKRELDMKELKELTERALVAKDVEELRALQRWDLLEKLHDVGLRQLCVPTKYGGGGVTHGGYVTRAIASEEAGYSMGSAGRLLNTPWMVTASMATGPVTEEQRDWFFSQFMENHHMFVCGTVSEPGGATDIHLPYDGPRANLNTFAYKDGNEWVINGDKMFSSGGGVSDLIQVATRTDKEAPISRAMTWFWVRKDTPGMEQEVNRLLGGELPGNVQTHYDDVRVPDSQRFGEVNNGSAVLDKLLSIKMLHFASMTGAARKLYEQVSDYAKQRIQGGKPIIEHSNIAAMLGEAAINLEATRAFVYRAAWENDQRELAGQPINLFWSLGVNSYCKKMAMRLCEVASEVYGGIGGSVDMPLEGFLRGLWVFLPGGSTVNMNAIKSCWWYNDVRITAPETVSVEA